MCDAAIMLKLAAAELGYREQGENRTKFGVWYGMDGQPWCMMFISWCAEQAGCGTEIIPRMAYCPYAVDWFRQRGQFLVAGTAPKPGDLVFFDPNKNGAADHVGLVESISGSEFIAIEGNRNNCVCRMRYSVSDSTILGFGRPAYQEAAAETVRIRLEESGAIVTVSGFNRDGSNFIRLRDVERLFPVCVGYDEAERIATLKMNYRG